MKRMQVPHMQKRQRTMVPTGLESDTIAATNARVAITRFAAQKPLGAATWRVRLERLFVRVTSRGTWGYSTLVVVLFGLLQFEADRWWLGTVLMLGPTWLGLLPVVVLMPLALLLKARLLLPLAAVSLLYVFGILGLCVPWPWDVPRFDTAGQLNVLTCHIHPNDTDRDALKTLIQSENIDVVALQDSEQAAETVFPEEWQVVREDGLTLAAPFPIQDVQTWQPEDLPQTPQRPLALYALIARPEGTIGICTVHLSSPRLQHHQLPEAARRANTTVADRLQQLNFWRDHESRLLVDWLDELPQVDLIVGNFNMAVESRIYRRWWSTYDNAFSRVGSGFGWTRWSQLGKITFGTRTDHALTANRWLPVSCRVGERIGSDHAPLLVELKTTQP